MSTLPAARRPSLAITAPARSRARGRGTRAAVGQGAGGHRRNPQPPDCATAEAALLRDTDHCIRMVDLWVAVNHRVSQDLFGHLAGHEHGLRARVESGGGRAGARGPW